MPLNNDTLTPLKQVLEEFDKKLNDINTADQDRGIEMRLFNNELGSLTGLVRTVESGVNTMYTRLNSLEAYYRDLDGDIAQLETNKSKLEATIASLTAVVSGLASRITTLESKVNAPSAPPPAPVPAPTPTPPPVVAPPPVPPPTPPPVIEVIGPVDNSYSRTLTIRPGDYYVRVDQHDTVVDLAGVSHPSLVVEFETGLKNVGVRNGSLKAVRSMRHATDVSNLDRVLLSNLNINNPDDSAISIHGSNVTITNVNASALRYCLYHGGTSDVYGFTMKDCYFVSQGPESTCRLTSVSRASFFNCSFTNGAKHGLRIHGNSTLVTLNSVNIRGAGNGLSIGSMGSQVPGNVIDVLINSTIIDVGGPDRLNLDRSGGLNILRIGSLKVRSPANWDLVSEYKSRCPADWNIAGLEELK